MAGELESLEFEVTVNQPAWLVWQTHMKNFQATMPKAVPGHFKAIEYLDGPPLAPGGVFKICYEEGFEHYDYVTFKFEEIDHDKFYLKAPVIDGGVLGKHFHDLIYNYKVVQGIDEHHATLKWKLDYRDTAEHDFHKILQAELTTLSTNLHDYINSIKAE